MKTQFTNLRDVSSKSTFAFATLTYIRASQFTEYTATLMQDLIEQQQLAGQITEAESNLLQFEVYNVATIQFMFADD